MYYILGNNNCVLEVPMEQWAKMFEKQNRIVKVTKTNDVKISTVFLGLDHQFGNGPPLVFETMIFGGKYDQYQWRCSTWDAALRNHEEACEKNKDQ